MVPFPVLKMYLIPSSSPRGNIYFVFLAVPVEKKSEHTARDFVQTNLLNFFLRTKTLLFSPLILKKTAKGGEDDL